MRLENKVALISGGARGMGAEEARLFAREGAKVIIGDVLDAEGRQTEAAINETGAECLFVHLDVTSEDDWRNAVARRGRPVSASSIFWSTTPASPPGAALKT